MRRALTEKRLKAASFATGTSLAFIKSRASLPGVRVEIWLVSKRFRLMENFPKHNPQTEGIESQKCTRQAAENTNLYISDAKLDVPG
jgi:protein gp37